MIVPETLREMIRDMKESLTSDDYTDTEKVVIRRDVEELEMLERLLQGGSFDSDYLN